jgi:hypothetical protein
VLAFHQGTTAQLASAKACVQSAPTLASVVSPVATPAQSGEPSCSAQTLPVGQPVACATTSMRPPCRPACTVSCVGDCDSIVYGTTPSSGKRAQLTGALARNVAVPLLKHWPKVGVIERDAAALGSPSRLPRSGRL